jgi:hypothetical protein
MLADLMESWQPTYTELKEYYEKYFSLGGLCTDIGNKFALVSLICFLTSQARKKSPDANCYQVIMKVIDKKEHKYNMDFIKGLSIICDDLMLNTSEFLTFDMKSSKEMVNKILEILNTWVPF